MWSVVVCDDNITERERIIEYVKVFSDDKGQEIAVRGAADWPGLFEKLKQAEPDVIIIAQNGVEGMDTLTNVHLPPRRFIWFSDLDFSLQAYRLCISWFGKKPVTYRKLEQALIRCWEEIPDLVQKGKRRGGV